MEQKVQHRRIEDESIIETMYKIGKMIGQGSFGVVFEAENLKTKQRLAIKKVNKEKAGSSAVTLLEREVSILKRVKHNHIIRLEEIFETSNKMCIVMELCELGDLKTLLFRGSSPFSEVSCRFIVKQLSEAIVYLHKNGIVHRDLKLENILITRCEFNEDQDPLYDIRLTDFGLSVVRGGATSESLLQTACGTPVYMAPEVIMNHDYSEQCDQWSIGVILYALLSRRFPFMADTEEGLYEAIKRAEVEFSGREWASISDSAKQLLKNILVVDPAHRYTAREVASHPWTSGRTSIDTRPPNVLALMKNFALLSNNDADGVEFSDDLLTMDRENFSSAASPRPDSDTTTKKPIEKSNGKDVKDDSSTSTTQSKSLFKAENYCKKLKGELLNKQSVKKNVPRNIDFRKNADGKSSNQSFPPKKQPPATKSRFGTEQTTSNSAKVEKGNNPVLSQSSISHVQMQDKSGKKK